MGGLEESEPEKFHMLQLSCFERASRFHWVAPALPFIPEISCFQIILA